MLPHPSERSERRKREVAFKKENEPDPSPRHTSEFKREAYQRRESTIAATYLAKKFFTAVWPSNSFFEASLILGRKTAIPPPFTTQLFPKVTPTSQATAGAQRAETRL
jgi:hypothetical protein